MLVLKSVYIYIYMVLNGKEKPSWLCSTCAQSCSLYYGLTFVTNILAVKFVKITHCKKGLTECCKLPCVLYSSRGTFVWFDPLFTLVDG